MNTRFHQKGMTAIGWLLVLGLIAFFTLITLRLVPLYLEYGKVTSVLESLQSQPEIANESRQGIVNLVSRRFDINDVRNVDPKLVTVSKNKNSLTIGIAYERREHLISNLDVVAKFDKKVEVPIR
jgi:Domain of unknown function (DUF4845)